MRHNHRLSPRPPASFLATSTSAQRKTYDLRYKRLLPSQDNTSTSPQLEAERSGPSGPDCWSRSGRKYGLEMLRTRKGLPGAGDDPPPLSRVQKRRVAAAGWGPARALGQSPEPASSLPRSPRASGSRALSSRLARVPPAAQRQALGRRLPPSGSPTPAARSALVT